MRILLLCHEYPPVGGGAASISLTLAETYAGRGHQVVAVTMGWNDLPGSSISGSGVELRRIACGRRRREEAGSASALAWAALALRWCRREHIRRPFDVVHAHFVMPAGIVAERLHARGIPFVLTAHGTDVPGFDPRRFRLAHRLVRGWWRRIYERAAFRVAPSGALEELLRAAAPSLAITRVPNPVGAPSSPDVSKEPLILLCGRLVERKGFGDFFRALRGVDLPGWKLEVVGDGPQRPLLEALAGELRAPVRFHGWLDRTEPLLHQLFARSAIFAFPSLRENLPVVLLEAMAAKCAIVATDLPGNVEALGSCARWVRAGNAEQMREAVVELVSQPERRRLLGDEARRRVECEFGDEAVTQRYLALLEAARR